MSMSLNRAQIIGNLTRDPELRQIPGGQTVASFSVATNFSWTDQSGQKQDRAEFHNIVAWRKLAEICGKYLKKGTKVFIEGRIQTRDWEGEDGVKRYRTEIVADNMIILDKKGDSVYNAGEGAGAMASGFASQGAHGGLNSSSGGASSDGAGDSLSAGSMNNAPIEEEITVEDLPF